MTAVDLARHARSTGDVLLAARTLVDPAMRAAVDTLPASTRRIAGYHLAWWDPNGDPGRGPAGGKAVRPALTLLAAEATTAGGAGRAVPAAVAVELVHNHSLLHDDVIDGDRTRRHRATAWSVFGIGEAILAGDALLTLAADMLADQPRALRLLGHSVQRLLEGQCLDLALEGTPDAAVAACEEMARAKTGALLGCACALGCVLAGGADRQVEHFARFGTHLGLAFQHVDDLLGIWGDPSATGKPVHSDLRNRKLSLPVVYALRSASPAGDELLTWYVDCDRTTDEDLPHAAGLVEAAGGRRWSRQRADAELTAALRELRAAAPRMPAEAELTAVAGWITRRDH